MVAKTRAPDLSGHTFGELAALRNQLRDVIDQAFDKLLSGEQSVACKLRLDADPYHDKLPYRLIRLNVEIAVADPSTKDSADGQ